MTQLQRLRLSHRCIVPNNRLQPFKRRYHALLSSEIRHAFLNYFESKGHRKLPSASLIPKANDQSLLFTNAGMVPFKDIFLGKVQSEYTCATTVQRCVRAGGKHNDLEQVGLTRRHHTLFEMLGNFSFGEYFKPQAIEYAWNFLTKELKLPKDRLHVTVLASDQETKDLWKKIANLSDKQIQELDEKENFWAMGDTGPCGPCSEIFWDMGEKYLDPEERYLEIWNLVFMQYSRSTENPETLQLLPIPCVDTGMGLERIASVLQRVPSNYHTDLYAELLENVARAFDLKANTHSNRTSGTIKFVDVLRDELNPIAPKFSNAKEMQAIRIVADHVKACYGMLADGIFPSNVGRGYVLRRIIRRAIRTAHHVGIPMDFSNLSTNSSLFLSSINVSGDTLRGSIDLHQVTQMQAVIENEEKAFHAMMSTGKRVIDKVVRELNRDKCNGSLHMSGEQAFRLYDTYGIPLELTIELAREYNVTVDEKSFHEILDHHKKLSSAQSVFSSSNTENKEASVQEVKHSKNVTEKTKFTGYESLTAENVSLVDIWQSDNVEAKNKKSKDNEKGKLCWISIDPCPFYAEEGGQIGDLGVLEILHDSSKTVACEIKVLDTKRIGSGDTSGLHCVIPVGMSIQELQNLIQSQDVKINGFVDPKHREECSIHHSATHLLQAALKTVLGDHITQSGSLVTSNKLRFDFTHFGALTIDDIKAVEDIVNTMAKDNLRVSTSVLKRSEAEKSGAICNFGDKYGEVVRVVHIGSEDSGINSREFCGGTHVSETRVIYPFKIVSEGSVAAGTRRLEAVAGVYGVEYLQGREKHLIEAASLLNTTPNKVIERLRKQQKQIKDMESVIQGYENILATSFNIEPSYKAEIDIDNSRKGNNMMLNVHLMPKIESDFQCDIGRILRKRLDFIKQNGIKTELDEIHLVILGSRVVCAISSSNPQAVHAGKVLTTILSKVGGKGGGTNVFAQGTLPMSISASDFINKLEENGR